ncbi:uncharacterized protein TNCV_2911811 [Trichonephila clavipes]|nr:uncharacterized protein TNCV_2911811 [Trichonephila clavipes]
MVSWEYLWPTLRCRREAGVSPLLSIGWWYLSSASPKRHCCRVSAADKECRVYPLDPLPDAVALYSGCTLVAAVNKSSTSTQAELVPSTSSVTVASPSKSQPPNSVIDTAPTTSNSLSISAASSSSTACSVFLKRSPLHPIPYPLHPRMQIKPQSPVERNVPLKTNPTL